MSNITELKVILSEYIKPDDGQPVNPDDQEIRPVDPDIPNTDKDTHTGDHGFFTISDVSNSEPNSMFDSNITLPLIALSFLFALLFAFLLPKAIRTLRNKNTERYDLKRSKFSTLRFLSTLFISSSLFFGLFSTAFGYKIPTIIDTTVSEELTINADIIGTNQLAFVKDTITIPASSYGYNLYISSDETDETGLIGDSTDKVISSIKTDGALADGTYGFTFDNPEKADAVFHPLQKKSERTAVRSFTKEETTKEQHIPIYYAVKASNLDESVYRTNIEYTTIDDHDLALEEVTPQVCAMLEEGVLDYTFKSSIDGKDHSVYKLKDGNCWTKEIPAEAIDPDDPDAPDPSTIPTICPANWHEAILSDDSNTIDNYDMLDFFYDVYDPDTETDERIVNLKDHSCISDFTITTFAFDPNDSPDDIDMPTQPPVNAIDFEATITLPSIPDGPHSDHFVGWSLDPNDENPYEPGQTITLTNPDVIIYAIWDGNKTPKAILDEDGLLNFVYDYYTVDEVIASRGVSGGYWENYEASHAPIKTEGTNCENNACVYLVPENASSKTQIPWFADHYEEIEVQGHGIVNAPGNSNPSVKNINFEASFKEFKPRSTYAWFACLKSLTEITNIDNLDTSLTAKMDYMFYSVTSIAELKLPKGFGEVAKTMKHMFSNCTPSGAINSDVSSCYGGGDSGSQQYYPGNLSELELPEGFGGAAVDMTSMFSYSSVSYLKLPSEFGRLSINMDNMFQFANRLSAIIIPNDTINPAKNFGYNAETMDNMFLSANSLVSISLPDGFGTKARLMRYMFGHNSSLVSLELPEGFGSKAEKMDMMFYRTYSLASLELPEGFGSQATHMQYMFSYASSLTSLEFPEGFGKEVEHTTAMFNFMKKTNIYGPPKTHCEPTALISVSFPAGFGRKIASMGNMFSCATALTNINSPDGQNKLPAGFGSQAWGMSAAFYGTGLTSLELPEGFGSRATDTRQMFGFTPSLEHIYVPTGTDWSEKDPAVTQSMNMFRNATRLHNYDTCSLKDVTCAYEGEKNGVYGLFEVKPTEPSPDSGNTVSPSPAPISGNSINPTYTPSIVEPTEPTTTPNNTNPQDGNTEPYGVIRKAKTTDKTDYALIIVTIISIALILLGALIIFLIEKRDKDEDDDIEEY